MQNNRYRIALAAALTLVCVCRPTPAHSDATVTLTVPPASTQGAATPSPLNALTSASNAPTAGLLPLSDAGETNAPLPSPTDQPAPDVPLPRPMHFGDRAIVAGAIDLRWRSSDHGRTQQIYLNAGEFDLTYPLVHHGVTNGNVVLQAIGEDPPDIHDGSDVEFGEAYVIYKLPLPAEEDSTAFIKAGQFQIPFGLLAVYDPHLLLSQPLYSESLGIRNDWGVAVSGRFYQVLNYDFSITRGVGPNVIGQVDPTEVVNFRLGRTFYTRNGIVNFGGSMLAGRLPDTAIDAAHPYAILLPASGRVRADRGYINKSRIAADGTLLLKKLTARAEAIVGADSDNRVLGYYAEGDYKFMPKFSALIARSYWRYPLGDSFSSDDQAGMTYSMSPNVTWRALYESLLDRPKDMATAASHRFTVQVLFRF